VVVQIQQSEENKPTGTAIYIRVVSITVRLASGRPQLDYERIHAIPSFFFSADKDRALRRYSLCATCQLQRPNCPDVALGITAAAAVGTEAPSLQLAPTGQAS